MCVRPALFRRKAPGPVQRSAPIGSHHTPTLLRRAWLRLFPIIAYENIVAIHNCGFDIEEGVSDAFELYVHLRNNNFTPEGFCFYTFDDVEEAIFNNNLNVTFGDFENDEDKALEIGKIVSEYLSREFEITWDGTINNQIEVNNFSWDKSYDDKNEYEIEGAYENFING